METSFSARPHVGAIVRESRGVSTFVAADKVIGERAGSLGLCGERMKRLAVGVEEDALLQPGRRRLVVTDMDQHALMACLPVFLGALGRAAPAVEVAHRTTPARPGHAFPKIQLSGRIG